MLGTFLIISIGIFCLIYFSYFLRKEIVSKNWPHVKGKVTKSFIERNKGVSGGQYHTRVKYAYTLFGLEYQSSTIRINQFTGDMLDAEKHVKMFPPDSDVCVYYNPKNLKESVLFVGVNKYTVLFILMGIASVYAGLAELSR